MQISEECKQGEVTFTATFMSSEHKWTKNETQDLLNDLMEAVEDNDRTVSDGFPIIKASIEITP